MTDTTDALAAALLNEAADYIEAYCIQRPRQQDLIARLRAAGVTAPGWTLVQPDNACAVCGTVCVGWFPLCGDHGRYGGVDLVPVQPAPDPLREAALEAVQSEALPGNIHRRLEAALAASGWTLAPVDAGQEMHDATCPDCQPAPDPLREALLDVFILLPPDRVHLIRDASLLTIHDVALAALARPVQE